MEFAVAKVTLPALSGRASGKLGNVVFFVRYGQQIARIRVKPTNPNTMLQQITRHNLRALSQAYKGSGSAVSVRGDGSAYVVLKKYDMSTGDWVDVEFDVLTHEEKQAWEMEGQRRKGYRAYGRLAFIGDNIRLLRRGQDPRRTP
ncbi:MAG: hypothetical protein QW706_09695 [Candidatus Nezhaarchaeales archaeon]